MQKGDVILFRAAKEPEDSYDKELRGAGYAPHFIPALHFIFTNQEELAQCLLNSSGHSGLIFTSQTAVQAANTALTSSTSHTLQEVLRERWGQLPVFVVGEATSQAVSKLGVKPIGVGSSNAEVLSKTILEYFKGVGTSGPPSTSLLFPCSSLRRDTIPSALRGAGLALQEVISYNTEPHPHLATSIQSCLERLKGGEVCAVFFSPSGVEFALRELLEEASKRAISVKIAAIGKTTGEALTTAGHTPSAVASKPTPQALLQAIAANSNTL